MNEIIKSKKFKIAAVIVGVVICALVIFSIGVSVGMRKGRFSSDWGRNYEKNFMGPKEGMFEHGFPPSPGMMERFEGKGMRNAHGIVGEIISISDNKIVIKNPDNQENTIAVGEKTLIKKFQEDLAVSNLQVGDRIVVMGKPGDDGMVEAQLIRVLPEPGMGNNLNNNQKN